MIESVKDNKAGREAEAGAAAIRAKAGGNTVNGQRLLYGAVDITTLQALAVGTNEDKIKEYIAGKSEKIIKIFKATVELEKNYKIRLHIEGFSPNIENIEEVTEKIKELWGLVYMLELDLAQSNTEIHIFDSSQRTKKFGNALHGRNDIG